MGKILQLIISFGGITLTGLAGLMVISNPEPKAYEQYATEELTVYLKDKVCNQMPQVLGGILQGHCRNIVDTGKPQIKELVAQKTERQNFLLFSIYRTELSLPSPVPSYCFETIAGFEHFYTYQAEQL